MKKKLINLVGALMLAVTFIVGVGASSTSQVQAQDWRYRRDRNRWDNNRWERWRERERRREWRDQRRLGYRDYRYNNNYQRYGWYDRYGYFHPYR